MRVKRGLSRSLAAFLVCLCGVAVAAEVSAQTGPAQTPSVQHMTDGRVWWNITVQERPRTESPWRWYLEYQGRTRDGVSDNDQQIVRPALGYDLTPRSSVWAGHGYTPGFPATGDVLTENRLWQQYLWVGPGLGSTLQWRTRFEERWIERNDGVAYRFRQFWRLTRPLGPQLGGLTAVVWDELFVHVNDTARTTSGFDQNRVFAGLGVGVTPTTRLEVGYVNQAINSPSRPNRRNHILLAFLNAGL